MRVALQTIALLLLVLSAAGAQQGDDPFALENAVKAAPPSADDDPFAPANAVPEKPAPKDNGTAPVPTPKVRLPENLTFAVAVEPKTAKPGETVQLTIRGTLAPGSYTYPVTQRTSSNTDSVASQIQYEDGPGFAPLWGTFQESAPVFKKDVLGQVQLVYTSPFTWTQDVLVKPEARPGVKTLRLLIKGQVCDAARCVPFRYPLEVPVTVAEGAAAAPSPALREQLNAKPPAVTEVPIPPGLKEVKAAAGGGPAKADGSLWGFLLISVGAAFAMLLTPCVFPMIPITVSFFLKQSEKEHHNPLPTAAVYSLTIIVVLAASMLVLGRFMVEWANSPWLNLGLGAVLVYFALSLFGMYEIELPRGLAQFTSAYESKGGYVGAFFMALTFTITSFTCTGPFLGPLLAASVELQLSTDKLILGSLAYSATFAAPFFVLALFPRLMKALPRSGGWLNVVKVVMGFLELAAALKFLANTDLAWNPGNAMLLNYETVLCAWIALAIACGLYLLGIYRLPHDSPVESLSVPRMLFAAIFLGLAVYMVPALWRITPQGIVGSGLVAFLPYDTKPPEARGGGGAEELLWTFHYEEAYERAAREGKLVFVDFTGQNCTNCRYNEKNVFTVPGVRQELAKYVRVQLYTDSVPDPKLSAAESKQQGERNSAWLSGTFDDLTNPFYAIVKPEKGKPPVVEADGRARLTGASTERTRKGLIPSGQVADFEEFLRQPLLQLGGAPAPSEGGSNGRRMEARLP